MATIENIITWGSVETDREADNHRVNLEVAEIREMMKECDDEILQQ